MRESVAMSVENICNIVFVVAFVVSIHVNVMISFFVLLVRRNLVSVLTTIKAEKMMVKKKEREIRRASRQNPPTFPRQVWMMFGHTAASKGIRL